jgi:hypothetical protein
MLTRLGTLTVAILITLTPSAPAAQPKLSDSDQQRFIDGIDAKLGISERVERVRNGQIEPAKTRAVQTILGNTYDLNIHQMRGATKNKVFISPDGHQEAVFDAGHQPVHDEINDGRYNLFRPQKESLRHFSLDTIPWLIWGHSRKDPTSSAERVSAYSADLFNGVIRALKTAQETGQSNDPDLKKPGSADAVAIFLFAVERGQADELLRTVIAHERKSDQDIERMVWKFEAGLQQIVARARP